jgi:hypothetical protein
MARIPVGKTIAFAYGFLFGQIGTVVAAAGIPALVYAGADFVSRSFAAAQPPLQAGARPGGAVVLAGLGAIAAAIAASSASAIAVTRVVSAQLGSAPRLPFEMSVIRMAAANIRFLLGTAVLVALAAGVSYVGYRLAGVPLQGQIEVQPTAAILLAAVVSWTSFIYVFVSTIRMGFLLPAVVAAEAKGGLKRSHELTQGNTWRAIAVAFALGLPIVMLAVGAAVMIVRSALGPDFGASAVTPELVQRVQQAINDRLLPWELFNAVIFVLYSGLMYSGVAFAYRAVAAADRDKPAL